jgi:ubiquinone/menaquinone biosynthesis C-methylase UbiE
MVMAIKTTIITIILLGYFGFSAEAANVKERVKWDNLTTTQGRVSYLEDQTREKDNQPDRVIEVFGVRPGDVVADVGSGTGLFTFRLSDKVGKDGKVIAIDILDDMLAYIDGKMKEKGIANIRLVKSSASDPHLQPASCDKILVANTYQHIGDRAAFLDHLRKSLKANGTIAIISHKGTQPPADVIKEMERTGFKLRQKFDFLKNRFFLVFN